MLGLYNTWVYQKVYTVIYIQMQTPHPRIPKGDSARYINPWGN